MAKTRSCSQENPSADMIDLRQQCNRWAESEQAAVPRALLCQLIPLPDCKTYEQGGPVHLLQPQVLVLAGCMLALCLALHACEHGGLKLRLVQCRRCRAGFACHSPQPSLLPPHPQLGPCPASYHLPLFTLAFLRIWCCIHHASHATLSRQP